MQATVRGTTAHLNYISMFTSVWHGEVPGRGEGWSLHRLQHSTGPCGEHVPEEHVPRATSTKHTTLWTCAQGPPYKMCNIVNMCPRPTVQNMQHCEHVPWATSTKHATLWTCARGHQYKTCNIVNMCPGPPVQNMQHCEHVPQANCTKHATLWDRKSVV